MQCVHFVVRHCSDESQYAVYGEEVATGVKEDTSVGVGGFVVNNDRRVHDLE